MKPERRRIVSEGWKGNARLPEIVSPEGLIGSQDICEPCARLPDGPNVLHGAWAEPDFTIRASLADRAGGARQGIGAQPVGLDAVEVLRAFISDARVSLVAPQLMQRHLESLA
ncbi:MAG: hypothetical protein LZF60_420066 [Nitrospira sp.]|nr:MAG: hypothetical protein LZF60_420066 [Nitrospira sp.]